MMHPHFSPVVGYEVQCRRAPAILSLGMLSADRFHNSDHASQFMLVLLAKRLIAKSPLVAIDDQAEQLL
jgi:hypothetical protein